ncbi:glycosyltransferase family 4 protein [Nitrospiraceae bacterium AH_259_D15_M11_P09]|nr:glycosyltransferase family 4 protein [Nitrospiraceae bacterium AH_259_D15_M11_P09]
MRVLIVHGSGDRTSGEYGVALEEAEALKTSGVSVHLHVGTGGGTLEGRGLPMVLKGARRLLSTESYRTMVFLVKDFRPDIVHFHGLLPGISPLALVACRKLRVPTVQTLHNFRWVCVEGGLFRQGSYCEDCISGGPTNGVRHRCAKGSYAASLGLTLTNQLLVRTRLLFRLVDRFIAVSNFVRDKYVQAGFPLEKIIVKPNPIDLPEEAGLEECEREGVLFVGRLSPGKGTAMLERLMSQLDGAASLTIIGDGPDRTLLRKVCECQRLRNVTFKGVQDKDQVRQAMYATACVVVPSQCGEASPRVAAEAMASKAPVVGSDVGGLAEIIKASGGGFCVAPRDVGEWLRAVKSIVDSPGMTRQLGEAGRRHVERHCSAADSARRLREIYTQVLASARQSYRRSDR